MGLRLLRGPPELELPDALSTLGVRERFFRFYRFNFFGG